VDYLQAYLVDDTVLGHRIRPNSSGHDAWGFRNTSVPDSAQIVAIGDSHTYGVSAPGRNSWPAQLGKLKKEYVYNLSLGGYGPAQYYYLLSNEALKLAPSVVILGFYFGNDLFDTHHIVYTKDYWQTLRSPDFGIEENVPVNTTRSHRRKFMGSFRDWLAHHSIGYRMFTLSFGNIFRFFEMKHGAPSAVGEVIVVEDKRLKIWTGLTPTVRLKGLDLKDAKIREGLRLTLELFQRMNDLCAEKGIGLLVVMIPTKESVLSDYLLDNSEVKHSRELAQLVSNERKVNRLMRKYFDDRRIPYVDVLPALKAAVGTKALYPANHDGHPNAEGYGIIADAVHKGLIDLDPKKTLPSH
jgi:hypothetical protein